MSNTTATGAQTPRFESSALPHFHDVWHVACLLTCDLADARRLTLDTFVRAFHEFAGCETPADCKVLLFQTMLGVETGSSETCCGLGPAGTDETLMPGTWAQDELELALGQLPLDLRLPLILSDIAGLCCDDVGRTLSIPAGAVRAWIVRGRRQLMESMPDEPARATTAAVEAPDGVSLRCDAAPAP